MFTEYFKQNTKNNWVSLFPSMNKKDIISDIYNSYLNEDVIVEFDDYSIGKVKLIGTLENELIFKDCDKEVITFYDSKNIFTNRTMTQRQIIFQTIFRRSSYTLGSVGNLNDHMGGICDGIDAYSCTYGYNSDTNEGTVTLYGKEVATFKLNYDLNIPEFVFSDGVLNNRKMNILKEELQNNNDFIAHCDELIGRYKHFK